MTGSKTFAWYLAGSTITTKQQQNTISNNAELATKQQQTISKTHKLTQQNTQLATTKSN